MIHYQLRCIQGHEFDGWFKDSAGFERQAASKLIDCPACGGKDVSRALMTPSLSKRRQEPVPAPALEPAPASAPASPPVVSAGGEMPDQLRSMLQRLRAEVEKKCDYVGPRFAEEARSIHRGESQRRGIYGEATPEQAEALADDGIEVARIPWVPRADG